MSTFRPGDSFYYFTIVRVLGAGAHGEVYEIRHRQTGDSFALKVLHAADCMDPRKVARALAGAKGNYRIEHRNVVQVLDLNCEANGLVWMRTELLRGYTVHELLARQGRLSLPFALAATIEAAFGLHAVHEAQIIHRDVKPSNLFYTEGRALKVLDLSLAKVFPEGLETTVGKRIGLGTPAYSAPEQLEGAVRPDVRFDVYGLGMTLWEMLAGSHPFHEVLHDLPELLKRQLTVMPPSLAEVARLPPRVDDVVRRAITKDPAERYGSMMEMARALMDLSAWAADEARARRIVVVVPYGEPPLPGDTNTWRDYRPPEPTPAHSQPASAPRDRVILAEPPPARAASFLVATELLPTDAPGRLAATLPLDDVPPGPGAMLTARGTALMPAEPARSSNEAHAERPAARELPPAVTRRQPSTPVTRQPRRTPWPVVIFAAALASLGSIALVVWLVGDNSLRAKPSSPPEATGSSVPVPRAAVTSTAASAPPPPSSGVPKRVPVPAKRTRAPNPPP